MRKQYGALPLRELNGIRQVMLVTSIGGNRWIIPKGRPEEGLAPHELAAREAWEEAGLLGRIGQEPIGRFVHLKRRGNGAIVTCDIQVFRLDVEKRSDDWPERGQRTCRWFAVDAAIGLATSHGLAALLSRFSDQRDDTLRQSA